jgi:predicted acyl esterase
VCGDVTLTDDDYHRARSPVFKDIVTPFLSAGNWGGHGLHLRGNTEGYVRSASKEKWLELHGLEHWTHFYTDYGRELQLEFFDHFLKGEDNGWDRRPPVLLQVRHMDRFEQRTEDDWPIPRTRWTSLHLLADLTLGTAPAQTAARIPFEATGEGLTFTSEPLTEQTEITGPLTANLSVSSSTADADLFCVFRVFDPQGGEVTFQGALDPHTPIAHGWLRLSHRRLDPALSEPYRPYHTHDRVEEVEPDSIHDASVEIWPTCIVVPAGYRLAFTVRGTDYEYEGDVDESSEIASFKNRFSGVGPFIHDDPRNRPESVFSGTTTLHIGPGRSAEVIVPIIPTKHDPTTEE